MKPLATTPVKPLRFQTSFFGGADTPVYPVATVSAGDKLRGVRIDIGLTLAGAASRLGLDAARYGELERGAAECDWEAAKARLMVRR